MRFLPLILSFLGAPILAVASGSSSAYPDRLVDYVGANADQQVSRFLEEDEDDDIDGDGPKTLGQRCNEEDKLCYPGLACTPVAFGSRCLPSKDCIVPKLEAFEAIYDMEALRTQVFSTAGITESELVDLMRGTERSTLVGLDPFKTFVASLRTVMDGPNRALTAISRHCGYPDIPAEEWSLGRQDGEDSAGYIGVHLEAGLLVDGVLAYLNAADADGGANEFFRGCGGVEIGLGAEVSFLLGGVTPGDIDDVQCLNFLFDTDLGFGTMFGVAAGIGLTGKTIVEITVGVGAGIGAGFSLCGTVKTGSPDEE